MMRSSAYNRFGVLMGTSSRASCPRWLSVRGGSLPMITLSPSQGDFCATAMRHNGGDTLQLQDHHAGLGTLPLKAMECAQCRREALNCLRRYRIRPYGSLADALSRLRRE